MTQASDAAPKRGRNLRPLATLVPYVRRHPGRLVGAGLALLAASGATLVVPVAVRHLVDTGFGAEGAELIGRYFLLLIGLVVALAAASALRFYFVTWIGARVVSDLRGDVFAHLTRLSPGFYDESRSGELVSRLTADTTQIRSAVAAGVSIALRNLVLFVGALILMVVTSPRLSGFVLIAIPIIVLPLIAFGRGVRKRSRAAQDTLAETNALATEAVGAIRTIQAFTGELLLVSRYRRAVELAFNAARDSIAARAWLTAFAIFVIFASVVLVLWIGAQDVSSGRITAGELGQFVLYAVFAASSLGELAQVWGELSQAAGAAERLAELRAAVPAIAAPKDPVPLPSPARGAIAFENVSFAYPVRTDSRVLDDVSFTVAPGETVAIVGPSGAGKSTLFHLLLRYYDPLAGTVRLDGTDIRRADPAQVRRRIAIVPQDTVVFAASAIENIRFGNPEADEAAVRAAAVAANADGFLSGLPEGYETWLGERGVTLSGGQRQRVAIARAVLKDAPILLLDEATSALDAESEHLVQEALDRLMIGRTTLVIAHRLATVQKADRIVVMDRGRIVETGTREALVARGGLYARLARMQFADIAAE